MKNKLDKLQVTAPMMVNKAIAVLMLGLLSTAANAAKVELGTVQAGLQYAQNNNLNNSDYVSEENIASDTLYFTLTSEQAVYFFADSFNFTNNAISEFRQIDILDVDLTIPGQHDNNYIAGIGDYYKGLDGGPANFTYTLGPGNYQINYKLTGLEQNFNPTRVVGAAVEGLGTYRLGFNVGSAIVAPIDPIINAPAAAVPEPETYALLLAGLGLIGFSVRQKKAIKTA